MRRSRSDSRIKRYVLSGSIAFAAMLDCLLLSQPPVEQQVLSCLNLNLNLIYDVDDAKSRTGFAKCEVRKSDIYMKKWACLLKK